MNKNNTYPRLSGALGGLLLAAALPIQAYEVADLGHSTVNTNLQALWGALHSDRGYLDFGQPHSYQWREGLINLGAELNPKDGGLYGRIALQANGAWGDGDASGYIIGDERDTDVEDAYVGYRTDALGGSPWSLDVSAGRQSLTLGNGFLVGKDGDLLVEQNSFDRTAVVALGRDGWKGQLSWFESDTPWQGGTEMAALTLTHVYASGLVEATYLRGLGVEEAYFAHRDGMDVYDLRVEQRLMDGALSLAAEVAHQSKGSGETAWALTPAYTFAELPGQPTLSLGYSRFSADWDSLFSGMDGGYSLWYGVVADNLAGPFQSNTQIWRLGLTGSVNESLSLGAMVYDYESLDTENQPNMGGQELNLYSEWMPNDWLYISPTVGWYDPDKRASEGGMQIGDSGTSFFGLFVVGVYF